MRLARDAKPASVIDESLPPHSVDAEQMAIACVLVAGDMHTDWKGGTVEQSQTEVDALLAQLRPNLFYDQRHKTLFTQLVHMRMESHAVNSVLVYEWLRSKKLLEECGGLQYITALPDKIPSVFIFPEVLGILQDKALRRWTLAKRHTLGELALAEDLSPEKLQAEFADVYEHSMKIGRKQHALKVWTAETLAQWQPAPHLRLVGDYEICMGYDGVFVVAGPGSSGKSLAMDALAVAGHLGKGATWQGRAVHRKFKTLIIQAENGPMRLKRVMTALAKNYGPSIKESIFITSPPEGGLPFVTSADFRTMVRQTVAKHGVDLVVIDPWSACMVEDSSDKVIEALGLIRSCFPADDLCPALGIVAHTKKPRPEDVKRGRALVNLVSGSIALTNTARTVYTLLPWTEDLTDDRIYWACPKLNNGENYSPSVWHRRFGAPFEPDTETDPSTWGIEEEEERRALDEEDVRKAYEAAGCKTLTKSSLAKRLKEMKGVGYSTAMRAFKSGPGGYLSYLVKEDKDGWLVLQQGKKE